jgi:hypothetical protein
VYIFQILFYSISSNYLQYNTGLIIYIHIKILRCKLVIITFSNWTIFIQSTFLYIYKACLRSTNSNKPKCYSTLFHLIIWGIIQCVFKPLYIYHPIYISISKGQPTQIKALDLNLYYKKNPKKKIQFT